MVLLPLPRRNARQLKGMPLRGDYGIPAGAGKEAFSGVINILEGLLPLGHIYKPVLNFPIGPLRAFC